MQRLYGRLGLELSGAARRRMIQWIHRHHHYRHRGRATPHLYSPADFGLDDAVIERRFAHYREWIAAST